MSIIEQFLEIKYKGERFSGGRLPLDVLADLQALEEILATFAREIWLKENDRERMPKGYTDWFHMSLTGVEDGSALPKLQLQVNEDQQRSLDGSDTRFSLMQKAETEFFRVIKAAADGDKVTLSPSQIRNFNRFLTNLKPGEAFQYTSRPTSGSTSGENIVFLDLERRKRLLTSVTSTYEQRIQGRARLKGVEEEGKLKFFSNSLKQFLVVDNSRPPTEYGKHIGNYYEFDLTVERRHDDSISNVITIHELSLLENPVISAIDEMEKLPKGWLDGFGEPISSTVREAAKDFVLSIDRDIPEFYAVAPTEEGGVLLEFKQDNWDYGVEFNSDSTVSYFGIDFRGEGEFSKEYRQDETSILEVKIKEDICRND
ncbi:hypothetical protein [Thalassospira mesophila]|uniref:Uncharacterized protein n=1 Tax=Thalassospira mesophila TaxID=1293891 RepID=A0A1Y2KUZ7_9PROT|nr:hypothetical protein [Thalassospira mesophila]OSQ35490.1 hypothetical protein TMES_20940 [Thalassospira mesophila]